MTHKAFYASLAALTLSLGGCTDMPSGPSGYYEVTGVDETDMLKMRAGPGIGYRVIVGLPNGTLLRIGNCQQSGSTRWCKATLKDMGGLRGYVSSAYLREYRPGA